MCRDRAVCTVKHGGSIVLVSQYCHSNDPTIDPGLVEVVEHCKQNRLPLVIGADSNSHSTIWGPDQNRRGDDFENFIQQGDLIVLNDGLKPTFYQGDNIRTYIDITLVNQFASSKGIGGGWELQDEETFSDHKMITFQLAATTVNQKFTRNLKKVDWAQFRGSVDQKIQQMPPGGGFRGESPPPNPGHNPGPGRTGPPFSPQTREPAQVVVRLAGAEKEGN